MNDISDLRTMHTTRGQNNKEIPFSKIFENLESCYYDILSGKSKNQCDEEGYVNKKIIKYIRLSNTPNDLKLLEESYRILKILNFINSQMKENKLTKFEDIMKYCRSNEGNCNETTLCNKSISSNCIFSLKRASESQKNHLKQKNKRLISRHLDDVQDELIKSVKHEIKKTDRGSWKYNDPLSGKFFPEIDPLTGRNAILQENPKREQPFIFNKKTNETHNSPIPNETHNSHTSLTKSLIFKKNPSETRDSPTSFKTPAYRLPSAQPFIFKNFPNETHNSHTSVKTTEQGKIGIRRTMDVSDNEIKTSTPDSDSAGGGIRASSSVGSSNFSKNNVKTTPDGVSKDSVVYGPPNRPNRSMALRAIDKSASYGSMALGKMWDFIRIPVLDPDPVRNRELWAEIREEQAAKWDEALYAAIDRENDLNAQRSKEMRMQDQED